MSTVPFGTVLRHLRKLASGGEAPVGSDGELLDEFALRRDEEAFAALVARHGPMVLNVCRRVLHHEQDAEDAFQAAFLVLAQNSRRIRKRESLGSWLHGVAYRTAMKARRSAARRRNHEARASQVVPQATSPTWDDVQGVLDEEIQRLPEALRRVFVLRIIQGRTAQETAAELGIKEGTVSSRLTRARQRLQQRLEKRGIKLAVLLAALAVAERTSVPAALAENTLRFGLLVAAGGTAAGVIPTHITALAAGVTRAMSLTRTRIATVLLLGLGLLAAGAGLLAHESRQSPSPAEKPRTPQAQPADAEMIELTGRVLGPEDKPVAGARLFVPHYLARRPSRPEDVKLERRATTDDEGRFQLTVARSAAIAGQPFPVIATADGLGLDWVEVPKEGAAAEVTLHLVKDLTVRGRLLNTEGKPVPGATLTVLGLMVPEKLDQFLELFQRPSDRPGELAMASVKKTLALPLNQVLHITASDREGRFEISGLGAERVAGFEGSGVAGAVKMGLLVTRKDLDARKINETVLKNLPGVRERQQRMAQVYGPVFDLVADPVRVIQGTIHEEGTGRPVAGVTVASSGAVGEIQAVSDSEGRYQLVGMPKAPKYSVFFTPGKGVPFLERSVIVTESPGLEPVVCNVTLVRGVMISGRVFDKATGKGVTANVRYVPLPGNTFVPKGQDIYPNTGTDEQGRFEMPVIPGPGVLLAIAVGPAFKVDSIPASPYKQAEFDAADSKRVEVQGNVDGLEGYRTFPLANGAFEVLDHANACKVVDVKEGTPAHCDLTLDPGRTLGLRLQGPDGKPVSGTVSLGLYDIKTRPIPVKGSECVVYALDPRRPRTVAFLHVERGLAGLVTVRGEEKEPPTVQLEATATLTGRLLDADGRPLAGAQVLVGYSNRAIRALTGEQYRRSPLPQADREGRFRLERTIPGVDWELIVVKEGQRLKVELPRDRKPLAAGAALDQGDVRARPE